MKKVLSLLLIVVIMLSSTVYAESDDYQIEGEWYTSTSYTNLCYELTTDGDGCFYNSSQKQKTVFYPDGRIDTIDTKEYVNVYGEKSYIESEPDTLSMKIEKLADESIIYYDIMNNELTGIIIIKDDIWKAYSIGAAKKIFCLNGKAISHDSNKSMDYHVVGNQLFFTNGQEYISGTVRKLGEKAFTYDIDADPWIVSHGDKEYNYGTPFYIFISTSIGN